MYNACCNSDWKSVQAIATNEESDTMWPNEQVCISGIRNKDYSLHMQGLKGDNQQWTEDAEIQ